MHLKQSGRRLTWNSIGFHCFAEIIRKYAAFAFSVDLCCVCVFSNIYQDFGQISSFHFYATELIFMTDFLSLRTKLFQKYCSDKNETLNLLKKCRKSYTFTPCIAITAEVRVSTVIVNIVMIFQEITCTRRNCEPPKKSTYKKITSQKSHPKPFGHFMIRLTCWRLTISPNFEMCD